MQIKTKLVSCHTDDSRPVKQEVNGTVILPPFSIPWLSPARFYHASLTFVGKTPCIVKLITAAIYGFRNKLEFVPGKPLKPSLVFKDKHCHWLITEAVNYDRNKFYDTGPRTQCYKTFLSVNYGFS